MKKSRLLAGLLSAAMVVGGSGLGAVPAMAATDGGNSRADATEMTSGVTVTDTLDSSDTVDWYKITTTSDGTVSFTFQQDPSEGDHNGGWTINFYDADGNNIQDQIYTDGQKKESAKVGFPAGTTIYVKVEPSGWSYPNGVAYNLTANATPSSTWETEYNNSMASADMLVNGTTFSGTIMNDDDEAD